MRSADGERYAPSNLAPRMLREAMGDGAGKAVQGTGYWSVPSRATLAAEDRRARADPAPETGG